MTAIAVKRRGRCLIAATDEDARAFSAMRTNATYTFEFRQQRNSQHHRKFMALVGFVADHSTVYDTTAKALIAVKVAVGHCEFHPHPLTGELVAVPQSISFARMDQVAFEAFYEAALAAVLTHLLPAIDRLDAEIAIDAMEGWL